MTKSVGFDKYWDDGGGKFIFAFFFSNNLLIIVAVPPEVAAKSLVEFIDTFDIEKTGEYWAPRGPGDIGTSDETMGKNLPTPLKLPY
jgi:hypothetical protein